MDKRNFHRLLEAQWSSGNCVCVGLDSEFSRIPKVARKRGKGSDVSVASTIAAFNQAIVLATADLVCAYKLDIAFYEKYGLEGIKALKQTIADIHAMAPDVPVILDAKRAGTEEANIGYAVAAFDVLGADAITVNPYLGGEPLKPFLNRKDKGVFVLCRTSNSGSGEFQDLFVEEGVRLYQFVARRVVNQWNYSHNCGLVVGANYPHKLREVRLIAPDIPILLPGIGAQGGNLKKVVKAGKDSRSQGMIINSSRGVIFASKNKDFAKAARRQTQKLRNLVNQY